ncbi:hypothetical protein [Nonomuraea sp. NPDC052265]|uniref:hypothetical protein n=1 Tax=Nonomuraea sp. NPDC052265 TaxID=3364374 RepID=UPI0037CC1322
MRRSRQRATVSVPELLVVARALDVPPLTLLAPPAGNDSVEILPGVETDPHEALGWLDGTAPPPHDQDDDGAGPRAELRLRREHHDLVADWTARTRAAARQAAPERSPATDRLWLTPVLALREHEHAGVPGIALGYASR